jgi:hypothetical protein
MNTCAQDASAVSVGSPIGQPLPTPVPVDYLTRLIAALAAQTEAINRLADSNMALVQAMAETEEADDPSAPPVSYMDGSPVR